MGKTVDTLRNKPVWLPIAVVATSVVLVLLIVFNHDKEKPRSTQEAVATAFTQIFAPGEWKPGMGPQPLMYHPARFDRLVWKPLPPRQGSIQAGNVPYPVSGNQR